MKRIFILLVVLLLVGGGHETVAQPGFVATPVSEKSAPASGGDHVYLKLEPITATIFRDQLPAGTFTVGVTLEIDSERSRTDIINARRRLRDIMFRELHAIFEREEYTGRKVSVDTIKRRMLVVTRRELGKDVVLNVFVSTLSRSGA